MKRLQIAAFALLPLHCFADEPPLLWPLAISPTLSSTFGETRSKAFHFGIDLKTWGKTGYDVRAVDDGHVMRVRTSPWGYGRALYEKLADDRIVVYAHLESFSPAIAEKVRAAQAETGRYTVDLWFEPEEILLSRGEIIAQSGESGAGPPHLHLELRDTNNVPLNPLTVGYRVDDTTSPTLRRVAFIPMTNASRVNGRPHPYSVALRWNSEKGRFESPKPVRVFGSIGVSVACYDRADGATNKLAPLENRLIVDGRTQYSARYDSISYTNAHQVRLDRYRIPKDGVLDTYFNLFRLPGNRLSFYTTEVGSGILYCGTIKKGSDGQVLEKGPHILEVESIDANGNRTRARLPIIVNAYPQLNTPRVLTLAKGSHLVEVGIADPDDDYVRFTLFRKEDKDWSSVVERRMAVRNGVFTFALDEPLADSRWRFEVWDTAGARVSMVAGFNNAVGRLEVGSVQAYGAYLTVLLVADLDMSEYPRVALGSLQAGRVEEVVGTDELRSAITIQQTAPREYELIADLPALRVAAAGQQLDDDQVVLLASPPQKGAQPAVIAINLEPAIPGEKTQITFDDGAVSLTFDKTSLYAPLYPQARHFAPDAPQELEVVGSGYELGPTLASFNRLVEVAFKLPATHLPEKFAVYEETAKGKWAFVGNELTPDSSRVTAALRYLGRFAVLADKTPPAISSVQPAQGSKLQAGSIPNFSARIVDEGSGIGDEMDLVLELDGTAAIAEYDPEGGRLSHTPQAPMSEGEHTFRVTARDQSGNHAEAIVIFSVQ